MLFEFIIFLILYSYMNNNTRLALVSLVSKKKKKSDHDTLYFIKHVSRWSSKKEEENV
jgi:hypothetical protein